MTSSTRERSAASQNGDARDVTVSFLAANIYGTVMGLLPSLLLLIVFSAIWSGRRLSSQNGFSLALMVILFVVGIVVHEVLHAVGFHLFGSVSHRDIQFGFKRLTPYTHSSARMPLNGYRWSILLPGLLLGILPSLLATVIGSGFLFIFGLFFTLTAGGDFLILWLLRGVPAEAHVADHPSKVGCVVYL